MHSSLTNDTYAVAGLAGSVTDYAAWKQRSRGLLGAGRAIIGADPKDITMWSALTTPGDRAKIG